VIVDGAPGLEAALVALWGEDLPIQRCTVHKHRNLLAHAPKPHAHATRLTTWIRNVNPQRSEFCNNAVALGQKAGVEVGIGIHGCVLSAAQGLGQGFGRRPYLFKHARPIPRMERIDQTALAHTQMVSDLDSFLYRRYFDRHS
jgi:hypothetical protein